MLLAQRRASLFLRDMGIARAFKTDAIKKLDGSKYANDRNQLKMILGSVCFTEQ